MTDEQDDLKIGIKKYWKRLKKNMKDPYFFVKIWQQITILAFLVGILIGAVFTQNYYIGQVNKVFDEAREKNSCFNNFYANKYNEELWDVENITPILIDGIGNNTTKAKQ